jgi:hypothetical protein
MSRLLTLLLAFLMQSPRPLIIPTNPPICKDVAVTVKSVEPKNYRFQLDILNNSSSPIVLLSRLDWNLAVKTPLGWRTTTSGGGSPNEHEPIEILQGKFYTRVFQKLDLWGDQATDHTGGSYRVNFTYFFQGLSPSGASLGQVRCPANPVVFTEPAPASRR